MSDRFTTKEVHDSLIQAVMDGSNPDRALAAALEEGAIKTAVKHSAQFLGGKYGSFFTRGPFGALGALGSPATKKLVVGTGLASAAVAGGAVHALHKRRERKRSMKQMHTALRARGYGEPIPSGSGMAPPEEIEMAKQHLSRKMTPGKLPPHSIQAGRRAAHGDQP